MTAWSTNPERASRHPEARLPLVERLKPLIERTVTLVGLATRLMTLGVRGLAVDAGGRVLLVRHGYVPGWYLPGGGVEPGETLAAALGRELAEEAGVEVRAARLAGIYLNRRVSRRDHVALYVIEDFATLDPAPKPNAEIREAGFFALDALPEGTTAATRRRIAEVLGGAAPAEEW